jgi:hypothetical protein
VQERVRAVRLSANRARVLRLVRPRVRDVKVKLHVRVLELM